MSGETQRNTGHRNEPLKRIQRQDADMEKTKGEERDNVRKKLFNDFQLKAVYLNGR